MPHLFDTHSRSFVLRSHRKIKKLLATVKDSLCQRVNVQLNKSDPLSSLQGVVSAMDAGLDVSNLPANFTSRWDLVSAFFFCGTIITTIGRWALFEHPTNRKCSLKWRSLWEAEILWKWFIKKIQISSKSLEIGIYYFILNVLDPFNSLSCWWHDNH